MYFVKQLDRNDERKILSSMECSTLKVATRYFNLLTSDASSRPEDYKDIKIALFRQEEMLSYYTID